MKLLSEIAKTSEFQNRPFNFIRFNDPEIVLNVLQQEQPQSVALVLAFIEPIKAAILLQNLSFDMQDEIIQIIAKMDNIKFENVQEHEEIIRNKISLYSQNNNNEIGGLKSVVEIIKHMEKTAIKHIVEVLNEKDPALSLEINNLLNNNNL